MWEILPVCSTDRRSLNVAEPSVIGVVRFALGMRRAPPLAGNVGPATDSSDQRAMRALEPSAFTGNNVRPNLNCGMTFFAMA